MQSYGFAKFSQYFVFLFYFFDLVLSLCFYCLQCIAHSMYVLSKFNFLIRNH